MLHPLSSKKKSTKGIPKISDDSENHEVHKVVVPSQLFTQTFQIPFINNTTSDNASLLLEGVIF